MSEITLEDIAFLTSDVGERLLAQLVAEDEAALQSIAIITRLRKTYTKQQVHAALTTARLRTKATHKFGEAASQMLFTDDALQQASDPLVRAYRARAIGRRHVLDVCCGIGADSMALAQTAQRVLGLEIDPVRVEIARYNARHMSNIHFEIADVRNGVPDDCDVIFFDPARRDSQGRRIYDVEQYIPPLSLVNQWTAPLCVVKLSPGVNVVQLQDYDGAVEFISVDGDLKEAVLWMGMAASGLKATLLTSEGEQYDWQRDGSEPEIHISEPLQWLVEPDPAVIRAGLVHDAAAAYEGHLLDETIAYFTTDKAPNSPWVRAWKILDWMPFNLKKLKAYLREHNVGQITVKKRGSPITPEVLLSKLKLKGAESRTLVLTRCQGKPIVLICAHYQSERKL